MSAMGQELLILGWGGQCATSWVSLGEGNSGDGCHLEPLVANIDGWQLRGAH